MTGSAAFQSLAQTLSHAVADGGFDAWSALLPELGANMSEQDRVKLAYFSLKSLEPEIAPQVAEYFLQRAGMPVAPLFNHMDEAAFWSDIAAPEELEAYCLACFSAMRPDRRAAFLNYIHGREAA
jgi:hypothetical protein